MEKLAEGYGLVEGPVWHQGRGLLYSDVLQGGVFALDRNDRVSTVVEHRRGIGGMALHNAGGLVVSGRNISFKSFAPGGETKLLLDRDPEHGNVGYNDITTDAAGRLYAGSLGNSPVFADGRAPADGNLYLIDLDGSARIVGTGIGLTNGLAFSPDGRVLYHSDSKVRTIWRYKVAADGSLTPKEAFVVTERGVPDGLVVAVDGSVWVALAGGGHGVAIYAGDGKMKDFLRIPQPQCTSLCFGGDDMRDLYIVSGTEGSGQERSGAVYRVRVDVPGLSVAICRVKIPA